MRILVTGVRGKVGGLAASHLAATGHEVIGTDIAPPVFEAAEEGAPRYIRADLTDAGSAYSVVRGVDAVVHAAGIPEPLQDVPHHVFGNNLMAAFNVIEASVRWGVHRLVNISSESVLGLVFAERPFLPQYCPIDEDHPVRPQDPYALAKLFSETLCDAAVRRCELTAVSIRPSWVQWAGNYEHNLGRLVADPDRPSVTFWSYLDGYDLAELIGLALLADSPAHEVVYAASPDNVGGRDLVSAMIRHYPEVNLRGLDRPDSGGISIAKARRLFGWDPHRSWRDYLDDAGRLRIPAPRAGSTPTWPGPVSAPALPQPAG